MAVRNPRGLIDDKVLNWKVRQAVKPASGPLKKKRKNMMIGTLCSVILCACGPASIPGDIAGDADPMPNPWDRYVRPSPQDEEMAPAPTHAPWPQPPY